MIQLNKQIFHVYMLLLVFFSMILLYMEYTNYSLIILYGFCLSLGIEILIKYVYVYDKCITFHYRDMKMLIAVSSFPFAVRIYQIMILLLPVVPIVLAGNFFALCFCKRNKELWN